MQEQGHLRGVWGHLVQKRFGGTTEMPQDV